MAQLKSTNVLGNLAISGNVLSSQFIKLGGTSSQLLRADGSAFMLTNAELVNIVGYTPVQGASDATADAIVKFSDTSGIALKNSGVTIDDSNNVTTTGQVTAGTFATTGTGTSDLTSGVLKFDTINIPTSSGGSTYGAGTNGQVLKSNGTTVYWASDSNSCPSALCATAAATAAKTASCTYYTATAKSYLHVVLRYTNTASSALTLNVNSQGAKPIYINGVASSASNSATLSAGSYLVYYDGSNYYFRTDGALTASITGNAATASSATNLASAPSLAASGNNITVTAGGKTSSAFTVPYATKATKDGDNNTISTTYLKLAGGTMTGAITSTYASSTWINSANGKSAFNLSGTRYVGWISGPSKNGRLVISSYPGDNDNLYFGYMKSTTITAGTNAFDKTMRWEGNTGSLFTDKYVVASEVTLQYNSTYKALEFSF